MTSITKQTKHITKKFNSLIEKNRDLNAYSDFKEGVNRGLDIAKGIFEDNVEKFDILHSNEERDTKINNLQNNFDLLIDNINFSKKPNCSDEKLEGIYHGFERSKQIFGEFVKDSV